MNIEFSCTPEYLQCNSSNYHVDMMHENSGALTTSITVLVPLTGT